MSIFNKILKEIDRGREGLNHGIPFGLPKTEEIIDGNTKETYTLILSNSGSGKTTLMLKLFEGNPDKCGFLSNDRIFITQDGHMDYFPIPIILAGSVSFI